MDELQETLKRIESLLRLSFWNLNAILAYYCANGPVNDIDDPNCEKERKKRVASECLIADVLMEELREKAREICKGCIDG